MRYQRTPSNWFGIVRGLLFWAFIGNLLIYSLIKFKFVLIPNVENAEIWNDIGANVCLTLFTSLGFWFVTDWVSSLFLVKRTNELERKFLDKALAIWNDYVHSLTAVHINRSVKSPNYIETHTMKQVNEMITNWKVVFAEHHRIEVTSLRPNATFKIVSDLVKNLRRLRKKFEPYEAQYSEEFNERYHEMIKNLRFYKSMAMKKDQEDALRLLTAMRDGLIELENVWRKRNQREPMKSGSKMWSQKLPHTDVVITGIIEE